jgi:hypothetical protein
MMNDFLMTCIQKFADLRRSDGGSPIYEGNGLDTPKGAYCRCDRTSDAFITFAKAAGYNGRLERYDFTLGDARNPDPTLYQLGQHPTEVYRRSSWHAIVETEYFLLDFTAKQYHQDACYPHIISHAVSDIPKFGHHVSTDDIHADAIKAAAAAGGE